MSKIIIKVSVRAPIEKVWEYWNTPEHITKWSFASPDWETSSAENDLRVAGKFKNHMQAKDGSEGFDFAGVYTTVNEKELIEYDMDDGRHVRVEFVPTTNEVEVKTTFDAEEENPEEVQRQGWQAILDNFKKYTEAN